MKKKHILYIVIGIVIVVGIVTYGYNKADTVNYPTGKLPEIVVNQDYQKNKKLNDDYVGLLKFDSGIIEEDVVQGKTNDTYLRTNWLTGEYDEEGSIFLDSENKLTDQNITIYGHYVYESYDSSKTHKFTPLELLLNEENYNKNKTLSLKLENETRKYIVVAVYLCDLTEEMSAPDNLAYYTPNFTKDNFEAYKAEIEKNQLYDTGVDYKFNNKFLTLQTCVENHPEQRQIVLCKQI